MKVNLQELAKALAQSDMHQGYIDIESGRVILMQDDLGEEEALNHVFEIEDDWEHSILTIEQMAFPDMLVMPGHGEPLTFVDWQREYQYY